MEEALAAGALPPAGRRGRSGRGRRFFGDKPQLYDAWAQPGGETWESIMVSTPIALFLFSPVDLICFCSLYQQNSQSNPYLELIPL